MLQKEGELSDDVHAQIMVLHRPYKQVYIVGFCHTRLVRTI